MDADQENQPTDPEQSESIFDVWDKKDSQKPALKTTFLGGPLRNAVFPTDFRPIFTATSEYAPSAAFRPQRKSLLNLADAAAFQLLLHEEPPLLSTKQANYADRPPFSFDDFLSEPYQMRRHAFVRSNPLNSKNTPEEPQAKLSRNAGAAYMPLVCLSLLDLYIVPWMNEYFLVKNVTREHALSFCILRVLPVIDPALIRKDLFKDRPYTHLNLKSKPMNYLRNYSEREKLAKPGIIAALLLQTAYHARETGVISDRIEFFMGRRVTPRG